MEDHMFIRSLLLAICICGIEANILPRLPENIQDFKCEEDDIGFKFNLTDFAGDWYETLQIPYVPGVECLNVSIPSEAKGNILTLDLRYVTILNNNWTVSREAVSFPWNNSTQFGIFHPDGSEVSYKLVTTDYVSIAVLCGYGSNSVIPIFKLFTRDREVSAEIVELINTQAEENGYSSLIYWEKQSLEECREPSGQAPLAALVGLTLLCGLSIWASN
ncbi:uncharacterized protein LOC26525991 [Drosophila erecta]|uniref:uncharacterized protein LOC26525991 n=1 Tax=Drosophila erecta TaxID=7220 RepID=UPI000732A063|nr:uncharacterized protein LOC26525991 [Drosophila erecta]KQS39018.1 uncharacterized protein Dere_GG26167 [Drosophila erecta]